ncbi:hypothetical protein, partial [Dyadobacter sp. Leaf189]|uniref:hypothetical protein n=1 Tax=Dyadobacter sp. Leaf189 TaxID=1736295 RepID=UPI00138F46F3
RQAEDMDGDDRFDVTSRKKPSMFLTNLSFCSLHHVKERCSEILRTRGVAVCDAFVVDRGAKVGGTILTSKHLLKIFSKNFQIFSAHPIHLPGK